MKIHLATRYSIRARARILDGSLLKAPTKGPGSNCREGFRSSHSLSLVTTLALLGLVAACAQAPSPGEVIAPPPDWPISLTSIQTEVNENKSGKNTFSFTMPLRASCTFPELDAALRKLQDEDKKLVSWTSRDDTETKLRKLQVTYRFDDPAEISSQVERLKLIAIQTASARATAVPTTVSPLSPVPGRTVTPVPTPTLPPLIEAHELYIDIAPPMDTLTGKSYKTTITLNPQTLAGGAGPCAVRSFTYQLTMPGEISSADLRTLADIDRQAIASTSPPGQANTVIWTVDLNQLAKGRAAEATRAMATRQAQVTELLSDLDRLGATGTAVARLGPAEVTRWSETESPKYQTRFSQLSYSATPVPPTALTLSASSQPQGAAIKFLLTVVGPIVALVGSIIAVIIGISKLRENLAGGRKGSGMHDGGER